MTQRYDTYKDSGVQWLGEIPGHWGCVALKRLINIYNGCDYKNVECTDGVPVFGSGGPFTYAREVMYDGEVVMYGRKGTIDKPLYYMGPFWTIDTMFYSVVKSNKLLAKFQYYVSTQMPLKKLSTSTALPSMTMTTLGGIGIPLPPISEQHAIVSYLDDKCGKIDEWIEKKQKEVELLGEMKQRVIADAVTRGLNPNVTMKQTNIPWLTEVPEHWKTLRAKHMFNKEQRPIEDSDEIVTCFRDGEVTLRKNRRTTGFTEATDYSHYQHICKGDLVIHQMDAFAGSAGVSDSDGMGTPVLSVCTPKSENILNDYYAHIVRLMGKNGFILSLYRGIRERSSDFRFDTFAKLWLPLPPLSEQCAIVTYINERTAKIDKMVENVNREIDNLKEYKQRLISDVVTGQIKVC